MSRKTQPSRKKSASAPVRKTDRRVRRTRDALGDALVQLMHERPFDEIKVQHVLDRAGVGRSTFYTHFRDKDDLFVSDVDEFFAGMSTLLSRRREVSDRVAPVLEMFAHLAEMRKFYDALVASGKIHDLMQLAQGHFARGIERRLSELPRSRGLNAKHRPAIATALAGSLLSLMTWWITRTKRESPQQMDDAYHRLVWTGLK
ncbi:MAG TPA: TetR/AcrR family transcriptional regulator [Candidatus Acidoferrales bacterium]|nr:TetR/AcrR family transcriptional regulator [Candidatus Acidoferrales bacterium]